MSVGVTISRPPHLSGVERIHASDSTQTIPSQQHEDFQFVFIEKGARRFSYRGVSLLALADSLILIPSGEAHSSRPVETIPVTARLLLIRPELLQTIADEAANRPNAALFLSAPLISDPGIALRFQRVHRSLSDPQSRLEQESSLFDLLCRIVRPERTHDAPQSPRRATKITRQLRDYIEDCYADEISLESLSEMAGLSPFHLCRVFRQETGFPPHAYQIQVRVHRARRLLAQGMAGGAVAQETGFASQSHFAAHFKRFIGMTPGRYARFVRA